MITRIVLLKLKNQYSTPEGREEVASKSREVLPDLPGVRSVKVGIALDNPTRFKWDVSLVLEFDSADDLEPFRVDPAHREYVDDFLKPRLEGIRGYNFED